MYGAGYSCIEGGILTPGRLRENFNLTDGLELTFEVCSLKIVPSKGRNWRKLHGIAEKKEFDTPALQTGFADELRRQQP